MITFRPMEESELSRLAEIDRTERITESYVCRNGVLERRQVDWRVGHWSDDEIAENRRAWQPWVSAGGTMLGAFDGKALAGLAIYRPDVPRNMAQLAILYVSRDYRGKGIGSELTRLVMGLARADGAGTLYVSATPSVATVEFYRRRGFEPTSEPDPQLLALEPEDIHMTLRLV